MAGMSRSSEDLLLLLLLTCGKGLIAPYFLTRPKCRLGDFDMYAVRCSDSRIVGSRISHMPASAVRFSGPTCQNRQGSCLVVFAK